tara:strand:+ start:280 stop:615 length:336 start_codon:yes stop_codon:yes gene_type:complete
MRWPSVHFWGWAFAWLRLPAFFALLFPAAGITAFIESATGRPFSFFWTFFGLLIVWGVADFAILACPRCGRYAYIRNAYLMNSMWPPRRCSKCDLDLKQFHPFDKRARSTD